jgi:hypothetical protein
MERLNPPRCFAFPAQTPKEKPRVSSLDPVSGLSGIVGIIVGVLLVAAVIQFVAGSLLHWLAVFAAIAVGIMAVRAIHG